MNYLAKVKFKVWKTDSRWVPYQMEDLEILEGGPTEENPEAYDPREDLWIMDSREDYMPPRVQELKEDEYAIVTAEFWGEWWQSYEGDWDADFEFRNEQIEVFKVEESLEINEPDYHNYIWNEVENDK